MSNPDTSQTEPEPSHPAERAPAEQVVRQVELSAPVDVVWAVLTDPDELAEWMGGEVDLALAPGAVGRVTDPDGTVRQVLITDVEPGERLAWYWWSDDDELSSVELVLEPLDGERTRIRVTETMTADVEPSGHEARFDGLVIDGFSPLLEGDGSGGSSGGSIDGERGPIAPQASVRSFALAGV